MKPLQIVYRTVAELTPYKQNPRKNDRAAEKVAESIKEFGFKIPVVIDREGVIVAGHTRIKAAKMLDMESVPCIVADDLTEEQIKAFRLADNKVGELADWDFDMLALELAGLTDFDMSDFGFDMSQVADGWFENHERNDTSKQEDNEEYNEFLDKFEPKKTTDDCYTPDKVYDAVADWVAVEYNVKRDRFVRPFFPGGDYQGHKYKKGDIVVDNPPFSILAEILRFYDEKGIKFFLFAPATTLFSSSSSSSCAICVGIDVVYENNATVCTSFLTNLEDDRCRTAPSLYKVAMDAVKEVLKDQRRELPKYEYPDTVVTSTKLQTFSKYGIDFRVSKAESAHIRQLDAQKESDKTIFGSGYLISEKAAAEKAAAEKAAAEKAAAEKWKLSEREMEIVRSLAV